MADEFGLLRPIAENGGAMLAVAASITLGFTKGAKWQPPEEELPEGVARVSSLLCAVAVAVLWKLGQTKFGPNGLAQVAIVAAVIAVFGLLATVYLNTTYKFFRGDKSITLGGFTLTEEAKLIQRKPATLNITPQRLFTTGGDDPDLVWTRHSRALVKVGSVVTYLLLLAGGPIAIVSGALLMGLPAS